MKVSEIEKMIPEIPSETNYWLFRTEGGRLYRSFIDQSVVSIGYPEMAISEIKLAKATDKKKTIENLKKLAEKNYPTRARPGLIASQLYRFFFELKVNDLIIIPFGGASEIAIGKIKNTTVKKGVLYRKTKAGKELIPDQEKHIEVEWIKQVKRNQFSPKLYQLFLCHQTIAKANDYNFWITSLIYDLYKYQGNYCLTLNIKKKNIPAIELLESQYLTLKFIEQYCQLIGFPVNITDLGISINLNSPGKEHFVAKGVIGLIAFGMIILAVNGGDFEFSATIISGKIKTPGIIENIIKLNQTSKQTMIPSQMVSEIKNLEITNPEQVETIVKAIDADNGKIE